MNIILNKNFLYNYSNLPNLFYLNNFDDDTKYSFMLFIYDVFFNNKILGKNALSNRTKKLDSKFSFSVLHAQHYHLGLNSTSNSKLLYSDNGTPIPRLITELYEKDYKKNYKKSDSLLNYSMDSSNQLSIYNLTDHSDWESLKNSLILNNNGISYTFCPSCNCLLNGVSTCSCNYKITVFKDVVNFKDYSNAVLNDEKHEPFFQEHLCSPTDFLIDTEHKLKLFINNISPALKNFIILTSTGIRECCGFFKNHSIYLIPDWLYNFPRQKIDSPKYMIFIEYPFIKGNFNDKILLENNIPDSVFQGNSNSNFNVVNYPNIFFY